MNTIEQFKKAVEKAQRDHDAARSAVDAAVAAQHAARQKVSESDGAVPAREALLVASNKVESAKAAVARAARPLADAQATLARLEPAGATLAKMDKLTAAIAARDAKLTAAARAFAEQLDTEMAGLRSAIEEASALWASLPTASRALDVSHPSGASRWASAPQGAGLFQFIERVFTTIEADKSIAQQVALARPDLNPAAPRA